MSRIRMDDTTGCCLVWFLIYGLPVIIAICFSLFSKPNSETKASSHKSGRGSSYSSGIYKPYEPLPDIVDSVYICTSSSSYAFHARITCGALNSCRSTIEKISVEEAWDMNRSPCQRCSRGVTFKETSD